jgi:hypothetical protein
MTGRPARTTLLVLISALVGGGTVFLWLSHAKMTNNQSRAEKTVREESIPTQTLSLQDGAGNLLGGIDVGDELINFHLYAGGDLSILADVDIGTGNVLVRCAAHDNATSLIFNAADGVLIKDRKRGDFYVSKLGQLSVFEWNRKKIFGLVKRFDDSDAVPTEDVRLRTRKGWVFASLGLGAGPGHPGMALADANGRVRVTWFQREGSDESDWWDLSVWDLTGAMRLSLQLRAGIPPDIVLLADDSPFQRVLDFGAQKLVGKDDAHPSTISWLPPMQTRPRRPIQVADNRGRKLWSAP